MIEVIPQSTITAEVLPSGVVEIEVLPSNIITIDVLVNQTIITNVAGGVTSVNGTANQITVVPTTGVTIVSLPNTIVTPDALTVSGQFEVGAQSTFNDDVIVTSPFNLQADVGGDLLGSLPNPTVHKIHGHDVQSGTPSNNDVLQYNSSNSRWQHHTLAQAGISAVGHTHPISDVTNLQTTLDGKAATSHTHVIADVTNLQTTLDGKAATSHTHALTDLTQTSAEKYMVPHWDGTNWTPIDYFGSSRRIMCQSEMNAAEAFTVAASGTGSANAFNTSGVAFDGRFGILNSQTGTTNSGRAGIGSAQDVDPIQLGTYGAEFTAILNIPVLSDSSQRFIVYAGFTDNRAGAATDGVYFSYTDNVNSGKWEANVISNSVGTPADTGITVSTANFYRLRAVTNAAGTETKFYIDGTLVNTLTNTHPTGSTRRTGFYVGILKTVGTTSRSLYIDYANIIIDSER